MKNKKIMMYISIVFILLIIVGLGYLVYINLVGEKQEKEISEYTPQEEITDEQIRMTTIELFYLDKNTNMLEKEIRNIDAKELINNPSKLIIEELLKGPNSENNMRIISENTKLNNSSINKGVLYLDFSEGFIEEKNLGKEKENLILESIEKTLKQLIEINSIKILINGQENMAFADEEITFNDLIIIK